VVPAESGNFAMKRFAPFVLLVALLLVIVVPFALAAATNTTPARSDRSPGAPVATAVSTVTGIAISPLLGTSAYGAYKWWVAPDDATRAKLPWYAQPHFWLPALFLVGICAAKDAFGATLPPGWKKPLDVLEAIENKFSGLVAAGAVIPFAIDAMGKLLIEHPGPVGLAPVVAHSGLAMIQIAAIDVNRLLNVLTVPFGIAVFALVWLASHAINMLILLSPWGAIDAALKVARTSLLGLITLSATMDPWLGAGLSLVVIVVSYFVAGWAYRLTIFGSVFCWDFLTLRRNRFAPSENDNAMFSGPNFAQVPLRTYGRLVQRTQGGLEFVYRRWPWLSPRVAKLPVGAPNLAVAQGMFFSDIVADSGATLFSLPPRYRGHESTLARAYVFGGGVQPGGLHKAWSDVRELVGGRAMRKAPLAA
jgi:hypothetical protein